ncbi:pyrimidine reductase family protein [Nocardia puris]|uniref:5-amino-6-(5-phosphoribosylamino)uracil reductase n=3 Tax=Nocardia puris TaxID=208602 RepID=A0A366E1Z8_9NOCA|nr:pyrimidine reductase family protein [Nocardia puris]MBF6212787.1 pyrimidine reductase family protein [Nocardia puris]MBF6367724.1 pyrimidine reductase family protein [Nocardia puris]MBF6461375.1 pyrimidine reductase family protein [Nocardia puris]RBO96390.1 5-amino-6-(5-phosphoribosylamino)uracil reductase [Nocardia puris]
MQRIPNAIQLTDLSSEELAELYAYPAEPDAPWVRANFVTSIDGAATSEDVTAGLGTPADKTVFMLLRDLADVVLVGAGTVRAENYGGARTDAARRRALHERGFGGHPDGTPPPIAVVTASAALDPGCRLFTDAAVPPLILTTATAPADRKRALAEAGGEVIEAGGVAVTPKGLLGVLAERGLPRVLCEGGPHLFGELLEADVVDELCVTTAPLLVGGTARRISLSAHEFRRPLHRAHVLLDTDGTVLTRWARR